MALLLWYCQKFYEIWTSLPNGNPVEDAQPACIKGCYKTYEKSRKGEAKERKAMKTLVNTLSESGQGFPSGRK